MPIKFTASRQQLTAELPTNWAIAPSPQRCQMDLPKLSYQPCPNYHICIKIILHNFPCITSWISHI